MKKKKKSHTLFQYRPEAIYGDAKYRRIITWASSPPVVCRLLQNFFTAFPHKIFPPTKISTSIKEEGEKDQQVQI